MNAERVAVCDRHSAAAAAVEVHLLSGTLMLCGHCWREHRVVMEVLAQEVVVLDSDVWVRT